MIQSDISIANRPPFRTFFYSITDHNSGNNNVKIDDNFTMKENKVMAISESLQEKCKEEKTF